MKMRKETRAKRSISRGQVALRRAGIGAIGLGAMAVVQLQ